MRVVAGCAALVALAACGHGAGARGPVAANGLKHAVAPIEVGINVEQAALPPAFEQSFCTAMFELNDKKVVCPDELRALMQLERQRSFLGQQESGNLPGVSSGLDAQRKVSLAMTQVGDQVQVTAVVAEMSGRVLGRFERKLNADGRDLSEKARALAEQIVSLPR